MEKNLEESDLKQINEYRKKIDNLVYELGELYLSRIQLDAREDNLKSELETLTSEEDKLLKQLNEKYGKGTIDLENKKFYPTSSE